MNIEYKVLVEYGWYDKAITALQEYVTNHLNAGWKPLGGPVRAVRAR